METILYAAFCGTGKSHLCRTYPNDYCEIECWQYQQSGDFPNNYIDEVLDKVGKFKYLLLSTNPVILKELYKKVSQITLVYPENSLKEEYMKRFCERNSPYDFIGVMYKHWDDWLNELKDQTYCRQIALKSGQYLSCII
jgi:hypothetical protein